MPFFVPPRARERGRAVSENGKRYRGKPFDFDATTPGPADRRDVLALRRDFWLFLEDNEREHQAHDAKLERILTIQAATFEAVTGKDVDTIPGIGEHARREARRRRAVQGLAVAVAVAAIAFLFGWLGRTTAEAHTREEVVHAP